MFYIIIWFGSKQPSNYKRKTDSIHKILKIHIHKHVNKKKYQRKFSKVNSDYL